MSCQDWHVLIRAPPHSSGCSKEIYCKIVDENQSRKSDTKCGPILMCNEPETMNIRLIKCPPKVPPPIGIITRNQDVEIVGSKLIRTCLCGARNGLDNFCPRVSCRSNPACKMKPWPRCWPQYKPQFEPEIKEVEAQVQLCYKHPT